MEMALASSDKFRQLLTSSDTFLQVLSIPCVLICAQKQVITGPGTKYFFKEETQFITIFTLFSTKHLDN